MKPVKDYINLLPQKEKGPSLITSKGQIAAALFLLAWLGLFGWQAKQQWDLKNRLAILAAQKKALQQQADMARKELGITAAGADPTNNALVQSLLEERVLWSEVFRQFSQIVPKGLWFDSLEGNTAGKAEIKIKGNAFNYLSIAEFMLAMEKSGYFNNPQLFYAQKSAVQGQEVVGFEIVSGIKKQEGAR